MAAASSEPSSLGARLKSARERAGLTVIQVAERLHVDPHLIEALEGERFEELGASVYARGHIRHYAELLGEPAGELQELYSRSAHAARTPDLTRVPKGKDPAGASSALLVPAVLVVVVVAVIGTVWWVAGTLNASRLALRGGASALQSAQAVLAVQAGATAIAPTAAAPASLGPGGAAVVPPVAAASEVPPSSPGAPSAGVPSAAGAPSAGASPAGASPGQAAEGTSPQSPRSPAGPERMAVLSLHFAEDSWTEVYDAHGERLLYDIGSANSTRTVSGVPPLKIVLGNPVVVSLELDGRPVSVPDGAQRNVILTFHITRSGQARAHLAAAGEHHASTASVQAP